MYLQGKVFVHPSLNRVYTINLVPRAFPLKNPPIFLGKSPGDEVVYTIREVEVRFRSLLANWAKKSLEAKKWWRRFFTQLIFGFSEGSKWT